MARYKAAAKLYVEGRLIRASEEFESDLPPGKSWIPLDDAAKEKVGSRPVYGRRGRPLPATPPTAEDAANSAAKDREARTAPKRRGKGTHKRASPGKSVAEQQSAGEEPTRGAIHDNE